MASDIYAKHQPQTTIITCSNFTIQMGYITESAMLNSSLDFNLFWRSRLFKYFIYDVLSRRAHVNSNNNAIGIKKKDPLFDLLFPYNAKIHYYEWYSSNVINAGYIKSTQSCIGFQLFNVRCIICRVFSSSSFISSKIAHRKHFHR